MTEVQDFMRHVQSEYLFYDKENDEFCPIVFSEADEEHGAEVCFQQGEALQTITDEQAYAKYVDALADMYKLQTPIPAETEFRILAFRHSDKDMLTGPARTIEENVLTNRVGYGLFKRKGAEVDPYGNWHRIQQAIEAIEGFTHWTSEDNNVQYWLVANFKEGSNIRMMMWTDDGDGNVTNLGVDSTK